MLSRWCEKFENKEEEENKREKLTDRVDEIYDDG